MLVFATVKFLISAQQLYVWNVHLQNIWYGDKWRNLRRFTYSAVAPLYVVGKFLISTEEKLICYPRKEEKYQRDAYSFISRVLSKQHQLAELERDRVREHNGKKNYRHQIFCIQEVHSLWAGNQRWTCQSEYRERSDVRWLTLCLHCKRPAWGQLHWKSASCT